LLEGDSSIKIHFEVFLTYIKSFLNFVNFQYFIILLLLLR